MNIYLDSILKKYRNPYHWLGARETAAFETEIVKLLDNSDVTLSDFRKVFRFIHSNDMDDSATGLDYLYTSLNHVLAETAKPKDWKWVKENCFKYNDRFMETVLGIYTEEKYRSEIIDILDGLLSGGHSPRMEMHCHFPAYYKAIYLKAVNSPDFEHYLDDNLQDSDMKRLKKDILLSRSENLAAFDLIKDEPSLVLDASELLAGKEQEEYLLDKVLNGREDVGGRRKSWWDKLCEIAGGRYLSDLMASPKHCEMVNTELYKLKRYVSLKERIDTGWIYDDLWGHLNSSPLAKYHAIKSFKKLSSIYPEWYAGIMIDYAVYMMDRNVNRNTYRISARTMVAAGRINDKCRHMAEDKAKKLVKNHPNRTAMIEELAAAGLISA